VQIFEVYRNHFTGRLPIGLSYLYYLETFLLQFNSFSGNLDAFRPRNGSFPFLSNIDISKNLFTGTLPAEAFLLPSLSSFAAVENCISGRISSDICRADKLISLALDGKRSVIYSIIH
jgi:hypothetical protein